MKLVFMGTPQFAVPSLEKLINSGYDIAAVVTQPDRKSGRGHKLVPPPVKALAEKMGIPVLQLDKIKSPEGVAALKALAPNMIVTAAFGQILSKEILDIPPLGCLNVHASLLPKYRGAAPIQWAVINGEVCTGVTIMYMNEGLDTGDIIISSAVDIGEEMTGGELYESLSLLGSNLLIETIENIQNGKAVRSPQDELKSSYYPPLSKELAEIDWTKTARDIHNLVRALDPIMGGIAHMGGDTIKIWRTSIVTGNAAPGSIVFADDKKGLMVGTGKGLLRIEEMQVPGSRRMSPSDYLRGKKLPGSHFE